MIMKFLLVQRRLCFVIAILKLFAKASSLGDNDVPPTALARRRRVYFGSMDSLFTSPPSRSWSLVEDDICSATNVVRRNKRRKSAEESDNEEEESRGNKLWPPWPFNLLTQRGTKNNNNGREDMYRRNSISLFWSYFGQRLLITKRQFQHAGSQLWFHLPPAGAPLILLSCIPQQRLLDVEGAGELLVKTAPAFLVNGFVRNLVLASFSLALVSWANSEVNRSRRLTPLPLPGQYRDIYRAMLPTFLPENVPDVDTEILRSMEKRVEDVPKDREGGDEAQGLSPRLRRHIQNIYNGAEQKPRTLRTTFREWKRMRELRQLEEAKVRRASIMDELIALQALKRKAAGRTKGRSADAESDTEPERPLGYALVTGASGGIGRALAVELARWEIPLILVARDSNRLTDLASDVELCYGVKCYVLQADLSETDAAERIYRTTKEEGLDVDLLISNAGVCSSGLSVDIPNDEIYNMMQVNALSVAMLNQLYGRDMKRKRRGRILVVSSIVGSVAAGPTVACYAATKAFERSLAMSMSKELEPYGVGVTCLLPGAVRDTAFKSNSDVDEALCWKLPFYARPASQVAHLGILGTLDGDVQVVPGWQNRAFVKVLKPILPQRLITGIVQVAWSPFRFSVPRLKLPTIPEKNGDSGTKTNGSNKMDLGTMPTMWPLKAPPKMLKLPEKAAPPKESAKGPLSIDTPADLATSTPVDALVENMPLGEAASMPLDDESHENGLEAPHVEKRDTSIEEETKQGEEAGSEESRGTSNAFLNKGKG